MAFTNTQTAWYATPGEWRQAVLGAMVDLTIIILTTSRTVAYGVVILDGQYGVYWRETDEFENTYVFNYMLRGLYEDVFVPSMFWYNSKGFGDPIAVGTNLAPELMSDVLDTLNLTIDNTLNDLIRFTNGATVEVVDAVFVVVSSAGGASFQIISKCTDGALVYVRVDLVQLVAPIYATGEDFFSGETWYGPERPTSDPAVTLSPGPQFERIADALEAISLNDQEVSINHGAAMWSAKGKVRVG